MSEQEKPGGFKKSRGPKAFSGKDKKPMGRPFGERKDTRFGPSSRGPSASFGPKPKRDFGGPSGAPSRPEGGSRPFTKRPFGDKPRGDRPFRDRDSGPSSRPFGDKPRGERSFGDRARGPTSRPFGDKPRDDRAFGDQRRGPSDRPFRDKERGPSDRPARQEGSRFRGMFNGPRPSGGDRDSRGPRPYRPDPSRGPRSGPTPVNEVETPESLPEEARHREAGASPHLAENELRYHGKNACLALLKSRPQDLVRAYVLRERTEDFASLIEFCAKNHLAYHLVGEGDLERLTDTVHHQGVCLIAKAKRFFKEEHFFRELGAHRTLVIFLDGVANPHNLGAILRTAAHFGVKWVCVPADEISKISPALYRTAEGGAELVNMVRIEDTEKFLDHMRSTGFQLYAFAPGEKTVPLFETRLNEKAVFVFGAEVEGLSGLVKSIVETKITIPGTGAIESLNVSVAVAVAMAEFERQGVAPRPVRIVKSKG